jgi:hypothetical protein
MRAAVFALLLAAAGAASSAELRSVELQYDDGYYTLHSEVWFDAAIGPTYTVFSDWDLSTEFSSAIVEARDLPADETGREGYYILNKGCVLFFCKSIERRGYVERESPDVLRAFADPEHSDFEVCDERWEFAEDEGGTVVAYSLTMKPGFWVPPAIGPYMIKRTLEKKAGQALDRVEALAREYAAEGAFGD